MIDYGARLVEKIAAEYGEGAYIFDPKDYKGAKERIPVICPDHGLFVTTPSDLLYKHGCKECRGEHPRGYPKYRNKTELKTPERGRPKTEHWVCALVTTSKGRTVLKTFLSPTPTRCKYQALFSSRTAADAARAALRKLHWQADAGAVLSECAGFVTAYDSEQHKPTAGVYLYVHKDWATAIIELSELPPMRYRMIGRFRDHFEACRALQTLRKHITNDWASVLATLTDEYAVAIDE